MRTIFEDKNGGSISDVFHAMAKGNAINNIGKSFQTVIWSDVGFMIEDFMY